MSIFDEALESASEFMEYKMANDDDVDDVDDEDEED